MMAPEQPTWIACLTPPGQAALATLGVYGPRAWETLRKLFRRRSGAELGANPVAGRFWLGRLGGEVADEVVVAVKATEPVPWLEVHGHGGREVVRFLLDLFREQGLQLCNWEDFLRKTCGDELTAEAAIALTKAATLRTASILLDQQQGALARDLDAIARALERGETSTAQEALASLARYEALGRHLTRPWRVVIAGAPNVGKSSLVNALAGYPRCIVAATPGTTRDVVTTRLALDGWLMELADTAGQRGEADGLEQQGIRQAQARAADADLCLWLFDTAAAPVWPGVPLPTLQYVVNKCDLAPAWDAASVPDAVHVSARTGAGLGDLCGRLVARLVPHVPPAGAAVPFTPWLCDGIGKAQEMLNEGNSLAASRLVAQLKVTPNNGASLS